MSEIFAEQSTAAANAVPGVFATDTAVLAGLAFQKQAREVRDQADMLDLRRRQLAEQEKASAEQAKVLKLQAEELQESLRDRERSADDKKRSQVTAVIG
ncbi:MAG TPA: hypothetical protein VG253_11095 [Streptosporangiaceae bacterium]|nr:hypothetical protein [Streptosporangiaceae bacterium]